MSLKCVIIDDEPLAINVIKNHIAQLKGLEIIKTFDNAIESLDFLRSNEVDLLFLDINMPVLDGLSFLKSLDTKPMVILTTAHEEYAVEGFELEVTLHPSSRIVVATNLNVFRLWIRFQILIRIAQPSRTGLLGGFCRHEISVST